MMYIRTMFNKGIFGMAALLLLLTAGCKEKLEFPIVPDIKMSDRQEYQSPAKVIIAFTDGDGDIGLNEGDTLPPYNFEEEPFNKYYYNLLMYYYIPVDGQWEEFEPAVPFFYRIPVITPAGQNKALRGEIEVDVVFSASTPDSIRFEIILIDRALHESNRLTTPTIYP